MPLTFALSLLLLQAPDPVTAVSGRVVESVAGTGVPGARVILLRLEPGQTISGDLYATPLPEGQPDPRANRIATLTGPDGSFGFRIEAPAKFLLFVQADGFVRTQAGVSPETTHSLEPGKPKTGIVLRITREASLSGRLVDADTGAPVRGLAVSAQGYRRTGIGRMLLPHGKPSVTREDGVFRIEGLPPGEYRVEARPPLLAALGKPRPVENFREAVELSWAPTWYPGVVRVEEALPVQVAEGVGADVGDMKIAKRRTASIRGRVLADSEGEAYVSLVHVQHGVESRGYQMTARGSVRTGEEFQIDRVSSGRYSLEAVMKGETASDRRVAHIALEIAEQNQDGLDLYLSRGVSISGRVRIRGRSEDEPALPSGDVRVYLDRVFGMRMSGHPGPVPAAAADGSFRIDGVTGDRYLVAARGVPGHAIAEVRYNGSLCAHGVAALDGGAAEHRVEVLLAPADGSILATVMDGGRPAAGATVVLIPDPFTDEAIELAGVMRHENTGEDGRATFAKLLPGAYRLIAYPKDALWGEDAGLRDRLRNGAEARVGSGAPAVIQVKLVAN